jgi:hypothetical protein
MFSAILSAIVLLGQAAPAAAPAPATAAKPDSTVSGVTVTPKIAPPDLQQARVVVCHDEQVLGSMFPKKVCATKQGLEERRKNDQEVTRDFQRSVIVGPQPH